MWREAQRRPGSSPATAPLERGRPLDGPIRSVVSERFGHDFSRVRIHTDSRAAGEADRRSARAFAIGEDIVFGSGTWDPRSNGGQRLLAHELAHVVQQRRGGSASAPTFLENAADIAANAFVAGGRIDVQGASPIAVLRQPQSPARSPGTSPSPSSPPLRQGSEIVAGLGARKQQLTASGASLHDMATAMLETRNLRADYAYGDSKTLDAANFGIFKQNWLMIRTAHPAFHGLGPTDYHRGAVLNQDLALDIRVLHESQAHYGARWADGHRNGASGLLQPGTSDIQRYREAVASIEHRLGSDPRHLTDDIRFWVYLPPI
jgi:hypothetical protein